MLLGQDAQFEGIAFKSRGGNSGTFLEALYTICDNRTPARAVAELRCLNEHSVSLYTGAGIHPSCLLFNS